MLLTLYCLLSYPLYPLVWLWLRWRIKKGKEDPLRIKERFGKTSLLRPNGKLVWLHAASVGESNSIVPLLDALHAHFPELNMLVTTGTVSSSRTIKDRLPERAFHQFVPIDLLPCVRRFLKHWKPDAAIWVESELWPNIILQSHARNIPMALINARMSDDSHQRWLTFRSSFLTLMSCFTLRFAGSKDDLRKFKNLGIHDIRDVGNLKYDAPALPADSKTTSRLLNNMGDRRIWLAASTHPGEELIIGKIHKELKETFPELLTLLVPRHADRGPDIVRELSKQKLTISCRSKNQILLPETDIYVADTMGELGIFYRLSGIVFIGGSLVPIGGHNPIEPAQLDCAVICGPHMFNFRGICRELMDETALVQVKTAEDLSEKVSELLRDHEQQEQQAQRALDAVKSKGGVVNTLISELAPLLGEPLPEAPDKEEANQ